MKKILILLLCSGLSIASLAQNIVQAEYFIDTDLGFGKNSLFNFTPASDGTFQLPVSVSGFQPGYHKLYIRTKDSDGKWSLTARRNIEVFASDAKTTIVKGEYFIDTDPGFGMATPITITSLDSAILQNFSAVASTLSEGYHKLYGRLLDNKGKWSLTFRRNMEVYKSINTNVVEAEYFFKTDNGFGNCSPVVFATPSPDGTFAFTIPAGQIPADADTLFVRVRDDIENKWSLTRILSINTALPLTVLNFSAVKQSNIVQLNWQTANEVNTAYFNIQRSTDAVHFSNVGIVNAHNRSGLNDYSYDDNVAGISATKLYYRLQEVDIDAQGTYSKIVAVNPDEANATLSIYPNPAKDYFNLISSSPEDLKGARLSIVDLSGQVLLKQSLFADGNQQISISSLVRGMYIIKIVKTTGVVTRKLLKQ